MQSEENKKNFRKFGLNNHSLRPADRWRLILSSSVNERKANEDSFDKKNEESNENDDEEEDNDRGRSMMLRPDFSTGVFLSK